MSAAVEPPKCPVLFETLDLSMEVRRLLLRLRSRTRICRRCSLGETCEGRRVMALAVRRAALEVMEEVIWTTRHKPS